jgi:hypothetical protein
MTVVVLDSDDQRCLKALRMAVTADQWPQREKSGRTWFLIPSQSENGISYLSDGDQCGCPDFARRQRRQVEDQRCKHCIAVCLYQLLLAAAKLPVIKNRLERVPLHEGFAF